MPGQVVTYLDRMADDEASSEQLDWDLTYDTEGWTNGQRANLTEALLDADVPHQWHGAELTITPKDEDFVDNLIYPSGEPT